MNTITEAVLRQLTGNDALVEALGASPEDAPLADRTRALVTYALRLIREPARMAETDLAALRAAGLSDHGIHDAAAIAAYYNFVNRLAERLGVALET